MTDEYTIRIHFNDSDYRSITIPKAAVRQTDTFVTVDINRLSDDVKAQLGGWFRGASSWLLSRL